MLSEMNQTKKDKCHMTYLVCAIGKKKKTQQKRTHRYRGQIGDCQMWGCGVGEMSGGNQKLKRKQKQGNQKLKRKQKHSYIAFDVEPINF